MSCTNKIPDILIVDDVSANLNVLSDILKTKGYKVRPVPGGEMALKAIEKVKPDLILLDIMMPDIGGLEVCRRLKENNKFNDIPILFISALSDNADIVEALKCGGVDYITKPFMAEEVLARVDVHLKIFQQQNELKQLNTEKDKFFTIIAHDLRSPFNGFLGLTEMLANNFKNITIEDLQALSKQMYSSAGNLYRLLTNLLEWAKMQRGLTEYKPENINLTEIINETDELFTETSAHKGINLIKDTSGDFIVSADKFMTKTIIRNLVSNALKFTDKGGSVKVSAKTVNGKVEISVKDTGIGMDKELLDNLFILGIKSSRKGTDLEPGTGLGLLLCKDFAEKQKGELNVTSEEGKGSEFIFKMPAVSI